MDLSADLRAVATELGATNRLTEPEEETTEQLRTAVDDAYNQLELLL